MAENRLSELLDAVNVKQLKKLEAFISSPFHNQNRNIVKLFTLLKETGPGDGGSKNNGGKWFKENIPNETFAKALFGGDKHARRKTILLLTEFKNVLSSFIMNEYMESNSAEKQFAIMKIYKVLNLRKNYSDVKAKYTRKLSSESRQTWDYYYRNLLLEHDDKLSRIGEIIYSDSSELKELSRSIDLFFICSKLEVYSGMMRHKSETLFSLDYKFTFRNILVDFVSKNEQMIKKEHPLLYSNYLILMMLDEKQGDNYFNLLKKYLLAARNKFDTGTFKDLIMEYKNSCDSKIHLNPKKYEKEIFFVYDLLDKKNAYIPAGGIDPNDFMNAVISALGLNKVKWAYYFFNKYKNKINSGNDDTLHNDTLHIVKARLDFHTKNYTAALNELNKINSKQFYFYLRIRILRIKIYYDLNEIDAVGYIIDAVRHYIRRNKNLIGTNFEIANNFLEYLSRIIRIRLGKTRDSKESILKELNKLHSITSKDWLLEKLDELK